MLLSHYTLYYLSNMIYFRIYFLICFKVLPIHIFSKQRWSIVAYYSPIGIDHWNNLEDEFVSKHIRKFVCANKKLY